MNSRIGLPILGALALAACAPHSSLPDGSVVIDDEIPLIRSANSDQASREITVDSDAILVALVDENLTDVAVRLSVTGSKPVEVENKLGGAGVEIATLAVPRGSRVAVTLTGPQNSSRAGSVHLRLRQFAARAPHDAEFSTLLAGYQAWAASTDASLTADAARGTVLPLLDRAIEKLASASGDPRLAGEARLLKAHTLRYYQLDQREARAEAQRAARAFEALAPPAALPAARARLVEARALAALALNRAGTNPSPEEAAAEARRLLGELAGGTSVFGPIERAHALRVLGRMDIGTASVEEAKKHYAAAGALYHAAGYVEGERVVRVDLATSLVEQGRFGDARKAFAELLPEVDRIADAESRITVLTYGGRAASSSGRTDEGADYLVRAIDQARKLGLRELESNALQELAYIYQNRGDYLQAEGLQYQALKIMRDLPDSLQLAYALEGAGTTARVTGDYQTAIAMHKEAVARSSHPVQRVREIRSLALDYVAAGDYVEAEKQLRASLAIELEDPRHHAYSDVKRNLAEVIIEHGERSPGELAEADRLLHEAMQRSDEVDDTLASIGAQRGIAALRAREGKTAAAMAEYERLFQRIFEYRRMDMTASLPPAAISFEQAAFRGYFDLVMKDLVARGGGKPRRALAAEERALRMLELARESHLGVARAVPLDAATAARADALLTQMGEKSLRIATLLRRQPSAEDSREIELLQSDMSNLRAELDRVRTDAALSQKASTSNAGQAAALDMSRPWRQAAAGNAQLSYALGNEHAYVWARSARGTLVAALNETPEALERRLVELTQVDPQRSPARIEQALEYISTVLLPPGLLADDSHTLEIVAEGRIASVPFAGLRSPTDPKRRLVETHAIALIPSLFASRDPPRPRQPRPFRLVALASGSGTLRSAPAADTGPKLQAAVDEISAIGSLFEAQDRSAKVKLLAGSDGSATALRGIWSSGADVVHFATHALTDLRQPLASLLVLPANDSHGFATYLTAGQVQEWRGDAELVFLSACDSAIGPPRFASGMPGLQSAFLRAGARGVIATLWPIEDVLAREFSADFYARYTRGEPAQQALNETQRAWLAPLPGKNASEQIRRRITALAHAYFAG